jgi:hypothetical protein
MPKHSGVGSTRISIAPSRLGSHLPRDRYTYLPLAIPLAGELIGREASEADYFLLRQPKLVNPPRRAHSAGSGVCGKADLLFSASGGNSFPTPIPACNRRLSFIIAPSRKEESMATVNATTITNVGGAETLDDGSKVLLPLAGLNGKTHTLAIPTEIVTRMIEQVASGYAKAVAKRARPPTDREVVEAMGFDFGHLRDAPESGIVVMTMQFRDGGTISYWMPRDMAQKLANGIHAQVQSMPTAKPN